MLIVVITLGMTDLLFALDSIPAIYGLTQEPYLVFTANVFALMGLRQLYFLIGGLLQRLVYLSYGLGVPAGLHRREADPARAARERAAVHQRRRARRVGAGDPDLALPGRHPGDPRRHHGRQPGQGPAEQAQGRQRQPGAPARTECAAAAGVVHGVSSRRPTLSVLDLVPVRSDQTTSRRARGDAWRWPGTADELGYRRYWVAEHHNMPAVAATNPPVLIAMLAGATRRIRVGSGGVMLPNHAPLVVAEQFALLEAAYPGRIDLGIGRAPGTDPVTSCALRHGAGGVERRGRQPLPGVRRQRPRDDGARRASGCAVSGRTYPLRATPQATGVPTVWLLGSSDYSARLAAEKGLPYVFAHHFSGQRHRRGAGALPLDASGPRPSWPEPRTFLTVNAVGRRDPRRRRSGSPGRSCWRCWRCAPAARCAPQLQRRGGREGRGARRAPRRCWRRCGRRWVVGAPEAARAQWPSSPRRTASTR